MNVIQRGIACMVSEAVEKSGLQKTYIANALGIPLAQLSRNLSGSRPFDLKSLDSLIELLELPKGSFYEAYVDDCWNAPRNRGIRIQELITHAISNELPEYADMMVDMLLESGKELCDIYKAAHALEQQGITDQALKLYDIVIRNERNRLADCLALSYYRRFMIVRNWDLDHAFEAATKLGEHVTLLPGKEMYEAYLRILTVFYVLDKWEHLFKYSGEVREVMEGAKEYDIDLYAECLSYQEISYRQKGEYDQALQVNSTYATLGAEYKKWSELNACIISLAAGEEGAVNKLLQLMNYYRDDAQNNVEHVLSHFIENQMCTEFEAVLQEFSDSIEKLFSQTDPLSNKRAIRVKCFIAEWYLSQDRYAEAIDLLIEALKQAKGLKMTNQANECLRILLRFFDLVSPEDKERIHLLI